MLVWVGKLLWKWEPQCLAATVHNYSCNVKHHISLQKVCFLFLSLTSWCLFPKSPSNIYLSSLYILRNVVVLITCFALSLYQQPHCCMMFSAVLWTSFSYRLGTTNKPNNDSAYVYLSEPECFLRLLSWAWVTQRQIHLRKLHQNLSVDSTKPNP